MARRFRFPSALVTPQTDGSITVRFFARETDLLVLWIDEKKTEYKFGKEAKIRLRVEADGTPGGLPELPKEDETYDPGIEFHFVGAFEVCVDGSGCLVVSSDGAIKCVENTGLPCSEAELNAASEVHVAGERGNFGPHFPK